MAGRESRDRHEQVVHRITRCGRLGLHRFVACWLGMASRLGERCSEGKCPLSPLKPARSQPPFHPRSRMIIGCEHVALAQHDRDVSPHTVTIKGFGGRSAPKRHNTPEAVDLARQTGACRAIRVAETGLGQSSSEGTASLHLRGTGHNADQRRCSPFPARSRGRMQM